MLSVGKPFAAAAPRPSSLSGTVPLSTTSFPLVEKLEYYKCPEATELKPGDTAGLLATYDSLHVHTFEGDPAPMEAQSNSQRNHGQRQRSRAIGQRDRRHNSAPRTRRGRYHDGRSHEAQRGARYPCRDYSCNTYSSREDSYSGARDNGSSVSKRRPSQRDRVRVRDRGDRAKTHRGKTAQGHHHDRDGHGVSYCSRSVSADSALSGHHVVREIRIHHFHCPFSAHNHGAEEVYDRRDQLFKKDDDEQSISTQDTEYLVRASSPKKHGQRQVKNREHGRAYHHRSASPRTKPQKHRKSHH